MIFNSLAFAIFLPIVFLLYWAIPNKYRWTILLLSSYYFYLSFRPSYIILLFLTTLVTYLCAYQIRRKEKKQKFYLGLGITVLIASLFLFKYFNFFSLIVTQFLKSIAIPVPDVLVTLVLPVGISFYSFKAISYLVDVYREKIEPERHFGYFAAYLSFFPCIVSGPIDRATNTLVQMKEEKNFDYSEGVFALRLMLLGFFKKMVLSDALTKYVDVVFQDVHAFQGMALLLASILFTIQIYCDFSGYSDIAIGTARLLGIKILDNFKSPYFSTSIKEFWKRWHISLSSWFRDYLYIPLGGSRVGRVRTAINVMITFLVSGLWHGANWTYVVWGGLHGLYLVIENQWNDFKQRHITKRETKNTLIWIGKIAFTFFWINLAWIFFRAESISDAWYVVTHLFSDFNIMEGLHQIGMTMGSLIKIVPFIILLFIYDFFQLKIDLLEKMGKLPFLIRWILYFGFVFVMIVLKIHNGTSQQFIYFQF